MNIIERIREKASEELKTIVFPRSSDPRVVQAAEYLEEHKFCKPVLLSNPDQADTRLDVLNIESDDNLTLYAESLFERRKHKGITIDQALEMVKDPLFFGASMLANHADGCVAGSVSTTGDVLRAAIQAIGLKSGSNVVSSTFLMSFEDGRVFTYGDCAVVPYPTSEQLASIAIDSAETHKKLTGDEARIAMLSFSTKGSAKHERVQLVTDALDLARKQSPESSIDGELQFDAALIDSIGERKAPGSDVAGKANVFIFPNLDAGNISYKITERLGGATATGPIIQGLAKPMMDLSRGCNWKDIVNTACVAALLSK